MKLGIDEARNTMMKNYGGPFGAVITKGDKVIAISSNTVIKDNDVTAHAEINAIRSAGERNNNWRLNLLQKLFNDAY